jgi:hypothetical protein
MMRDVFVGRTENCGHSGMSNLYCSDQGGKGAVYFLLTGFRMDVGLSDYPVQFLAPV